jgi:hypothetical protein
MITLFIQVCIVVAIGECICSGRYGSSNGTNNPGECLFMSIV